MRVEVLYSDGCPNHEALLPRLRTVMERAGIDAPIEFKRIDSVQAAEQERFLGSPTVRVNGRDVDPTAGSRPGGSRRAQSRCNAGADWRAPAIGYAGLMFWLSRKKFVGS